MATKTILGTSLGDGTVMLGPTTGGIVANDLAPMNQHVIGVASENVNRGDLVTMHANGTVHKWCEEMLLGGDWATVGSGRTEYRYCWKELELDCTTLLDSERIAFRERAAVAKASGRLNGYRTLECDFNDREFGEFSVLMKAMALASAGVDPTKPLKMRADPMSRRIIVINGKEEEEPRYYFLDEPFEISKDLLQKCESALNTGISLAAM